MRIPFNPDTIAALEPPAEGECFAWCSDLGGFGIRVLASGRKSFVVQHRSFGRKTLGQVGLLKLGEFDRKRPWLVREREPGSAFAMALDILEAASKGKNWFEDQAAAAAAEEKRRKVEVERSVRAMIDAYLAEPDVRGRRSFAGLQRYLEKHWEPVHHLSAETLSRHDLIPVLRKIATERGPVAANRARSVLSGLFAWALVHGELQREFSPTLNLPKWEEQARDRVLEVEELAAVWRAAPEVNPAFGAVVRLLILTGCRKSEVAGLMWREVDLDRALLTISGARTKNRRALTVPLAPAAVAILEGVPRFSDVLVFPSFGWGHTKKRLDELAGIGPWVIHDIRRSCRSLWIEEEHGLGLDVHLCELMLGHALPGIIGVYDRATRLPERRRALERWADLVLRAAGEPVEGATVVRIRS